MKRERTSSSITPERAPHRAVAARPESPTATHRTVSRSGVYAELSLLVAREGDVRRLVANACEKARQVLEFDRFGVLWLSPQSFDVGTFFEASAYDPNVRTREVEIRNAGLRDTLAEWGGRTFDPTDLADVMRDLFDASGTSCVVTFPIEVAGKPFGMLGLASRAHRVYPERDLEFIRVLAVHLGSALRAARAEEEIRHLASIVQSTDLVIVTYDLKGRVTSWNPAAERMLGYTAAEMLGQPITSIVPVSLHADHRELLNAIAAGKSVAQHKTTHLTRGGHALEVLLFFSPTRDAQGRINGVVAVARDVTEERRADERFRVVVESAPNAMVMIDAHGHVVLVNAEAERLFGRRRAELVHEQVDRLLRVPLAHGDAPRGGAFGPDHFAQAMTAGLDYVALRQDGANVPVEVAVTPLETSDGPVVLLALVDVTERKLFEAEQRRLLHRLQEAVEARDTFLSVASHELKTPLTALQLSLQSLIRRLEKPADGVAWSPDAARVKVDAAHRQVLRLANLVEQLLDVSRIATGHLTLELQDFDLSVLVREVMDRFSDGGSDQPAMHVRVAGRLEGRWDRSRLDQILTNLVSNALKYGEGKPIDVIAEPGDHDGSVRLIVRDRGIGIPHDARQRLFQRFERLVSHRHFGGLGLGLWIVRQFVEAHGGTIEVQSELGQGSTFTVMLPRRPVQERPSSTPGYVAFHSAPPVQ